MRILLIVFISFLFLSGCASHSARTTAPTVDEEPNRVAAPSLPDDIRPGTIMNFQNSGLDSLQRFTVEKSYFSALGQRCFIGRILPESAGNNTATLCVDEAGKLKPAPSIQPLAIQP